MKVRPNQLERELELKSPPLLIVSGDEPLLVDEACDLYRQACRRQGLDQRLRFDCQKGFQWQQLTGHLGGAGLFGERQLIELHLAGFSEKPLQQILSQWLENPDPDTRLLCVTPRLSASQMNNKWFREVEAKAVLVQIWPLKLEEFPEWLNRRLQQRGLKPTRHALELLVHHLEGNLLAATQEIEKLRLLNGTGELDEDLVLQAVSDSSRYSVNDIAEAICADKAGQVDHMLQVLRAEGIAPALVLWSLSRIIRALAELKRAAGSDVDRRALLRRHQLPITLGARLEKVARKVTASSLQQAHGLCVTADEALKGLHALSPWDYLYAAAMILMQVRTPLSRTNNITT